MIMIISMIISMIIIMIMIIYGRPVDGLLTV
jgi:hypothetical protein